MPWSNWKFVDSTKASQRSCSLASPVLSSKPIKNYMLSWYAQPSRKTPRPSATNNGSSLQEARASDPNSSSRSCQIHKALLLTTGTTYTKWLRSKGWKISWRIWRVVRNSIVSFSGKTTYLEDIFLARMCQLSTISIYCCCREHLALKIWCSICLRTCRKNLENTMTNHM